MTRTSIGWIPTVLGNLSFKSIGHSGYPYPFFVSFTETPDEGKVLLQCLQKRVPSDYQIPLIPLPDKLYLDLCSFIGRKFFKENIENTFLLLASGIPDQTGTVQELTGKIFKISRIDYSEQKEIYSYLQKVIQKASSPTNENLHPYLEDNAFFVCDFNLNRQGICRLSSPSILKDAENCNLDAVAIHKLTNQCFFFIKDAFHSHKHHDKSEDTLISTYKEKDKHGVHWSEHILKELYRYILKQRPVLSKNSLGIFSYIRTFEKIISHDNSQNNKEKTTSLFNRTIALDELEKSISIQIEKKEESISYRRWFVGFFLAVIQITSFYIYSSNKVGYSEVIANNTGFALTIAASILLAVLVLTKNINPRNWKSSTRFFNLIISYFSTQNKAIFALLVAGFLSMLMGYFLL